MNPVKIRRAQRNGIKIPIRAMRAANKTGVPFAVVCALLEKESAGGKNVWGHDGTWMIGYPRMNQEAYSVYKTHRSRFGAQGVGPMQLTYPGFQDEADKKGGCWKVWPNLLVGCGIIKGYMNQYGNDWVAIGERYNGAREYGIDLQEKIVKWRNILND